jgi:hypothetical protein
MTKQSKQPERRYRQPWPAAHLKYYASIKAYLELIISLAERGINRGVGQRNIPFLEKAGPMINMIARRLVRAQKEYDPLHLSEAIRQGRRGAYWINEVVDLLEELGPEMDKQTRNLDYLARAKMWPQVTDRLNFCLNVADRILGKLLDGPVAAEPPPVDDTLIEDALQILGLRDAQAQPAENLQKNFRQTTRLGKKRLHPNAPRRRKKKQGTLGKK